jgi:hypothetical protein
MLGRDLPTTDIGVLTCLQHIVCLAGHCLLIQLERAEMCVFKMTAILKYERPGSS